MTARIFRPLLMTALGCTLGLPLTAQAPVTVEDVLSMQALGAVTLSPDGRLIAYVLTSRDAEHDRNDSDLWAVGAETGEPYRLTYHGGVDASPGWHPGSQWLAFLSDRSGKSQVWGIDPRGGEAWEVTDSPSGVQAFEFSPDGRSLAFLAPDEKSEAEKEQEKIRGRPMIWGESYPDEWTWLRVAPLEGRKAGESQKASASGQHVTDFVWSPDSRQLAFAARPSPILRTYSRAATYLVTPGQSPRRLLDLPGGESPVDWSSQRGLIVSASGHELGTYNSKLWRVELPAGQATSLTDELDENARLVRATDTGLLVQASHRTGSGLYQIPINSGKGSSPRALSPEGLYFSNFSASRDGQVVACIGESAHEPPDIFVSRTGDWNPLRRTRVNPQLSNLDFGEQQVVSWKSRADGEEIEGILTLPVGYQAGQRVPLLLVIHGGPSGVSSNRFLTRRGPYPIQVFAGLGYAVLQPNYRGSTGYGERFRGLNRGDISGKDWIDIDSGVDALVERGIADPERLGIMGWSFGGHHTYWGITQTDRFKAASAGAGANDLISMYSETDLPAFYHTYLGPKPWEDFDLYEERSAYRRVTRVVTPLLIQVGERDERVPAEQSIQFYEAVKAIGKAPTQLVIYPGQPHGIRDARLIRDLMERNVKWFQRWIPVGGDSGPSTGN